MRAFLLIIIVTALGSTLHAATLTYTYDDLNRVTRVESSDGIVYDYTYDVASNRQTSGVVPAVDSDGDGLSDPIEDFLGTDELLGDSDGDGILDGDEDANRDGKVDPGETSPTSTDTDADGMDDGWEVANNLNPLADDADLDTDGDGYSNIAEYDAGTDPQDAGSHPQDAPAVPAMNTWGVIAALLALALMGMRRGAATTPA